MGDACGNALAESAIGVHKTEFIARQGTRHGLNPLEYQTLGWVAGFNQVRLLSNIGIHPPAAYGEQTIATPDGTALVPAHT